MKQRILSLLCGELPESGALIVLGGHVEMNFAGYLFPWESQYHPREHVLQLTKGDVLAPARGNP